MTDKMEQDKWYLWRKEDILSEYCELHGITRAEIDYDDLEEYKLEQYGYYRDTEESDHMKEGCSFSKGER